jgi:NAD-dependent deacetylase
MTSPFPQPPKFVLLTGPALSREAGFAPFDAAGLPDRARLEDVLTPDGFARDPERVRRFYNEKRRQLLNEVTPTVAHDGLAALDIARRGEVLIVTRNIDDLHERAGAEAVVHTHGDLLKARCAICAKVSDSFDDIAADSTCPICGNAGHLRPHVVWVGEPPLRMEAVYQAVAECELFALIGMSAANQPVAGLLADAKRRGARTLEFNVEPSPASAEFDESHIGKLTDTVPDLVRRLIV